ncbi:MAG: PilN domain-containing protein [Succinivibrionaceae bacterium]
MSNINLLPWRQELKDRRKKTFAKIILTGVVIGFFVSGIIAALYSVQIEGQKNRNQTWRDEIRIVDAQIVEISKLKEYRQSLIDRMNAINILQQSRNYAVRLYSDLPTLVASGIYLTGMKVATGSVKVSGLAESNPRLSSMLRNIDNSKWLGNGAIAQTRAESKDGKKIVPTLPDGLYEFNMSFVIKGDTQNANNGGAK